MRRPLPSRTPTGRFPSRTTITRHTAPFRRQTLRRAARIAVVAYAET
ncbi:hypothetical protein [Streptantibioticus ferralitis]|uniref:Uncharacterized protein n=1 Tax=Streptantibioticus ferralitis TaxID=236510 RepID=A0ABT5YT99_9ACTN|nr:hypothetical protein [Streptantibioticus ferralitis]MDF2254824.1 hypothetical protein [Streptantibioticus ferralitis]